MKNDKSLSYCFAMQYSLYLMLCTDFLLCSSFSFTFEINTQSVINLYVVYKLSYSPNIIVINILIHSFSLSLSRTHPPICWVKKSQVTLHYTNKTHELTLTKKHAKCYRSCQNSLLTKMSDFFKQRKSFLLDTDYMSTVIYLSVLQFYCFLVTLHYAYENAYCMMMMQYLKFRDNKK